VPEQIQVIRPSALLAAREAQKVLAELESRDVSRGGIWSATPGLWQRYDVPWDGMSGTRGSSQLVGTIGVVFGTPTKYDITIYRATVTEHGLATQWTVDRICDDALQYAGQTLASCPRINLPQPGADPFHQADR
jgi:hypothetical protein